MASEATLRQYASALVTLFVKQYTQKYGKPPSDLNRYRDRWGFQGMAEDFGKKRSEEIINYYLSSTRSSHPVGYLLYNYDKINETMLDFERDVEARRRLREETRRRVEEWSGKQRG